MEIAKLNSLYNIKVLLRNSNYFLLHLHYVDLKVNVQFTYSTTMHTYKSSLYMVKLLKIILLLTCQLFLYVTLLLIKTCSNYLSGRIKLLLLLL